MAPETVISIKQSFLNTQTRLLAQPLAPSRGWRAANEAAEDGIPERALDEALLRANQMLLQHERRVHPPQATRHVAEQIDDMYWKAGERAVVAARREDEEGDGEDGGVGGLGAERHWRDAGADITDPDTIALLPPTWTSQRDVAAYPMEVKWYSELVERLQTVAAEKAAAAERVARLRRMQESLAPFESVTGEGAEDGNGVQENLVTRNGEMEKELERMRILLLRVSARVDRMDATAGDRAGETEVEDPDTAQRKRVGDLLEKF